MVKKRKSQLICWVDWIGSILTAALIFRIVLMILRAFNTWLLPQAGVPFVSIANIQRIALETPGIIPCVLLEIGVLCYAMTLFLAGIMVSITAISRGWSWSEFTSRFRMAWRQQNWRSSLLLLADLVVTAPLFSIFFRTPLLTEIRVPEVYLDYGSRNVWIASGGILLIGICLFLLVHYWNFWRLVNLRGMAVSQAFHQSHEIQGHSGRRALKTCLLAGIGSWLVNVLLAGLQRWMGPDSRALSICCLVIAEIVAALLCCVVIIEWVRLIEGPKQPQKVSRRYDGLFSWSLLMLGVLVIGTAMQSYHYFQPQRLSAPVTISHKGVADDDGVQNTVQALQRTSRRYHPDYVEMDIHETKDRQFVVMHDENLHKLTGVNKRPRQLTLHQVTSLTAQERGQKARVASFDNYLAHAKRLHQKLIVELKTTRDDSPDVVKLFNRRYGKLMVQRHYIVHSLDYGLVRKLHRLNPQMHILYLQAYNFTNPMSTVEGFNNEYSSLNQHFIEAAHRQGQPVYAWTVNRPGAMKQLVNERVDGIVTDRLPELQSVIHQTIHYQSDLTRYWSFLNPLANI